MSVVVECPACSTKLSAPDAAAGRQAKCPRCSRPIDVPGPGGWDEPPREHTEKESLGSIRAGGWTIAICTLVMTSFALLGLLFGVLQNAGRRF